MELDALLENGAQAMVVEVKAKPDMADIDGQTGRMERVRRYADLKGDKRRFFCALAAPEFPAGGIDDQVHVLQGDRPQRRFLRSGQKQGRTRRITVLPVDFHRLRYPAYLARAVDRVCAARSSYLKTQLPPHRLVDNQSPRAGIHQRPYRAFPDILACPSGSR